LFNYIWINLFIILVFALSFIQN